MYKKYLFILLVTSLLMHSLQFIFNYFVDPYGLHSLLKQSSFKHQKVHKPYALIEKEPSRVIIGNSRNLYSFEPNNTGLKNFYNFSLGGIGIRQVNKLFQHAIIASNIKEAIITLDQICDPRTNKLSTHSIDERFLLSNSNSRFMLDTWKILLYSSLDTTKLSLQSIKNNHYDIAINASGRRLFFNEGDFLTKGYGHALKERELKTISRTTKSLHGLFISPLSGYDKYKLRCNTSSFDNIISQAIKHKIKVKFLLNPVNVRYWAINYQTGRGNKGLLYKKLLIQEKLLAIPEGRRDNFWAFDFLRLNDYTEENLFYEDGNIKPKFWYESSHYKLNLGDLMLNVIINDNFLDADLVSDLKLVDIEKDFESQRVRFKNWRKMHPSIIAEIESSISDINKGS